jgi:20S proteasome subunit alpha 4
VVELVKKLKRICILQVVESGGKNIEVAVMTREEGVLKQLEEEEIDIIVAEIEAEKAAAEAAKKGPAKET